MSGALEGRIAISLHRNSDGSVNARVNSSRPQLAQRLLAGRSPEQVPRLVGAIFSLCGQAQSLAAELAVAAALNPSPTTELAPEVEFRMLAEWASEHAWRLLLDWPKQCGLPLSPEPVQKLRQATADPQRFITELEATLAAVLGEPSAEQWLAAVASAQGLAAFDAWCRAGRTPLARSFATLEQGADRGSAKMPFLPALERIAQDELLALAARALEQPEICTQPEMSASAMETGALARCLEEPLLAAWQHERGAGIGARMVARLLELARLPARLKQGGAPIARSWSTAPGNGVAAVETSRGLLVHVVQLESGEVAQYRIIAPTEWNFRTGGPLESAVAGLSEIADHLEWVRQTALSMDPCVTYSVEWSNA